MISSEKFGSGNHESVQIGEYMYDLEKTHGEAPAQDVRGFFIRYWEGANRLTNNPQ